MYTLREVKKADRKAVCNTNLGNQYHVLCYGSEGYEHIRNTHFFSMGYSNEQVESMQNPFIIHADGSKEIYLYEGREYYIMTESGRTFENLSGLIGEDPIAAKEPTVGMIEENINKYFQDLNNHLVVTEKLYRLMNPNGKKDIPSFAYEKTKIWYNEWMYIIDTITFFDWCLINKCTLIEKIDTVQGGEELIAAKSESGEDLQFNSKGELINDVLKRPTNYSLAAIFERLKSGRKKHDQLLLQDLIDLLVSNEPFVTMTSQEFDCYNNLLTRVIERHVQILKNAEDIPADFKVKQLLSRGFSATAILGQI